MQLSLAIGSKGQNARLCARLTGYNIDIRPEGGYYGEDEELKLPSPRPETLVRAVGPHPKEEIGWHKRRSCPPVHRLHDQPPQGTGAGGARPQRRDQHRPRGRNRAAEPLPGPGLPGKGQKKKALERCFEQPVPAEVYDALAAQLADVEKEAQPNGEA